MSRMTRKASNVIDINKYYLRYLGVGLGSSTWLQTSICVKYLVNLLVERGT